MLVYASKKLLTSPLASQEPPNPTPPQSIKKYNPFFPNKPRKGTATAQQEPMSPSTAHLGHFLNLALPDHPPTHHTPSPSGNAFAISSPTLPRPPPSPSHPPIPLIHLNHTPTPKSKAPPPNLRPLPPFYPPPVPSSASAEPPLPHLLLASMSRFLRPR